MPLDGMPLIVEPKYPKAKELMKIGRKPGAEEEENGAKIRNIFWSWRWRCDVLIWEKDGKIEWGKVPNIHGLGHALSTLGASDAWGIKQEAQAVQTLAGLVSHRAFKQYVLTGSFMETSKRSGVTYLFRRLRPTVAITNRGKRGKAGDHTRILCALCLHPIAYYESSWAGAMVPTDDVIAHLMLMRGDEPLFWKRANQHPPYRSEAGL